MGPIDCSLDTIPREIEHRDAAAAIAAKLLRRSEGYGRYPQVPQAANCTIAMLMQMTADDKSHLGPMQPLEQARAS